jgi:hypothetical protein
MSLVEDTGIQVQERLDVFHVARTSRRRCPEMVPMQRGGAEGGWRRARPEYKNPLKSPLAERLNDRSAQTLEYHRRACVCRCSTARNLL